LRHEPFQLADPISQLPRSCYRGNFVEAT